MAFVCLKEQTPEEFYDMFETDRPQSKQGRVTIQPVDVKPEGEQW